VIFSIVIDVDDCVSAALAAGCVGIKALDAISYYNIMNYSILWHVLLS
jgi:hypothetical protein